MEGFDGFRGAFLGHVSLPISRIICPSELLQPSGRPKKSKRFSTAQGEESETDIPVLSATVAILVLYVVSPIFHGCVMGGGDDVRWGAAKVGNEVPTQGTQPILT